MQVKVKNNNIEGALRLFKRKVNDSGVLFKYREKEFYEKPAQKRKRKQSAAKQRERKRRSVEP
ncbi:30S ribosomal protein S21 [bacterium]|jgi:small subunit ribosomal protein S21|nr:30S ribosomal protein S21 [bacterium]MDB4464598.1 30S ribosomal protein S21 [bacterium]|tara:strand:+ start:228 stop:416 length:189 start_codon:yes stop_codon:yes gene_type:complete